MWSTYTVLLLLCLISSSDALICFDIWQCFLTWCKWTFVNPCVCPTVNSCSSFKQARSCLQSWTVCFSCQVLFYSHNNWAETENDIRLTGKVTLWLSCRNMKQMPGNENCFSFFLFQSFSFSFLFLSLSPFYLILPLLLPFHPFLITLCYFLILSAPLHSFLLLCAYSPTPILSLPFSLFLVFKRYLTLLCIYMFCSIWTDIMNLSPAE